MQDSGCVISSWETVSMAGQRGLSATRQEIFQGKGVEFLQEFSFSKLVGRDTRGGKICSDGWRKAITMKASLYSHDCTNNQMEPLDFEGLAIPVATLENCWIHFPHFCLGRDVRQTTLQEGAQEALRPGLSINMRKYSDTMTTQMKGPPIFKKKSANSEEPANFRAIPPRLWRAYLPDLQVRQC